MRLRQTHLALAAALFALASGAQDQNLNLNDPQAIRALLASSFTKIRGKETPELVPFNVRMQHFFYRYKYANGGGFQAEAS